jgi:hypothetical protein
MKNFPKINLVSDALHGMAYYIFQKSLRSLQEFRKNPHDKIPPKSSPTNFQSLCILKNQIFIRKDFFLRIRPTRPSLDRAGPLHTAGCRARTLGPSRLAWPWCNYQKPSLLRVCAARRQRLLPLSPPSGPHLLDSPPSPRRPTPVGDPPRRRSPRTAAPRLGCPRAFTALPHHSSPLIPFKPSVNGP